MPPPSATATTGRHVDPYARKPLTSKSRQTLQRSLSQGAADQSFGGHSMQSSQTGTPLRRDYSRASSAASNRSTASTRSLSKEQVREKMQKPPDIPTCRGGNINVYRCSAEFLEDFWAKQKSENDARRLAIKKSQQEHERQVQAEADRNPTAVARAKPVLNATVASRTAQLRPPPTKSAGIGGPSARATSSKTPAQPTTAGRVPATTESRTASAGKAPVSARATPVVSRPASPATGVRTPLRTPSSTAPKSSAGTRSATITDSKPIGTAPRSASTAKKPTVAPSSTAVNGSTRPSSSRATSATTPSRSATGVERKVSSSPVPRTSSAPRAASSSGMASSKVSASRPTLTGTRTSSARPTKPAITPTPTSRPSASTSAAARLATSTRRASSVKTATSAKPARPSALQPSKESCTEVRASAELEAELAQQTPVLDTHLLGPEAGNGGDGDCWLH